MTIGWALFFVAVLAVPTAAVATYLLLPVPISEGTLTNSIGSGYAQYVVTAGDTCWHARRTEINAETPMPARQ